MEYSNLHRFKERGLVMSTNSLCWVFKASGIFILRIFRSLQCIF